MAQGGRKTDFRRTKKFRDLQRALHDSLERRGLLRDPFIDKAEEYLDFWVRRQELKADIAERGLTVTDDRGRQTENRSVSLEVQVSRQMLTLWNALGFKAEDLYAGDDDEL